MSYTSLQLTIRGLDAATKEALVRKAKAEGVSVNRYALAALRRSVQVSTVEQRYREMKEFFKNHHLSSEDAAAIQEAIAWSKKTSIEKQARDERDW